MSNRLVVVPSIRQPITKSPGFAKKGLSTWKLDLMALCGFGCRYCSSNTGNYLRINREPFAKLTEAQLGVRALPTEDPDLAFVYSDVLDKIDRQITSHGAKWGAGETLVMSMLTDAFSGPPLHDGTTEKALRWLLDRTSFRIRILTKNSIVGTSTKWREFFRAAGDRVVVGLSTGTLDMEWAKRVEIGTPPPQARTRATLALQDDGVPTFGMLCPIFPDVMEGDGLARLVASIRPERCETVWAEPFNDRDNWRHVQAGYALGSVGWAWLESTYGGNRDGDWWSRYAADLYLSLVDMARVGGWLDRLKYLLYEGDITESDALWMIGREPTLPGMLLQDPKIDGTAYSRHRVFSELQRARPDVSLCV